MAVASTVVSWPPRRWLAALAGAAVFAVGAGVPTDVVPNPLFTRMTPVRWWNYPTLAVTALLGGLVLATYVRTPTAPRGLGSTASGGLLSALAMAVRCTQASTRAAGRLRRVEHRGAAAAVLGLASIALLGWPLRRRLATERACPIPVNR